MIDNNSTMPPAVSGGSVGSEASTLPSGIVPPHMMLNRKRPADDGPVGRAPMKEYMDRVVDRQKWEDVSSTTSCSYLGVHSDLISLGTDTLKKNVENFFLV